MLIPCSHGPTLARLLARCNGSSTAELFAQDQSYDIFSPADVERAPTTRRIMDTVKALQPRQVFVDAVTTLRYLSADALEFRRQVFSFLRFLVEHHATVLMSSETAATTPDDDLRFIRDGIIDLCILDGHALDRLEEQVRARREAEQPLFLPFLLVTPRSRASMITRHLWQSVDELIITPIEKPELWARVTILLRARELSLELGRRVAEAEQATRTRDVVLAMVAHDLRNPLNLVLSAASLVLELGTGLAAGERKQLQVIHRAAERMDRLIQDLLEVSSIESGQVAVEPRPQPPALLVSEAYHLYQHAAAEKGLELTCDAGADLPEVRADHDRILQVFSNLIDNALKFTPAGGRVMIRAELDQAAVRFSVADTGPGIPESDLPHLFDRFWQAEHSGKGGAGLGLAIARGIIAAHGGEIWAESALGRGTTFSFRLPA